MGILPSSNFCEILETMEGFSLWLTQWKAFLYGLPNRGVIHELPLLV
jgi:hypothetical protein